MQSVTAIGACGVPRLPHADGFAPFDLLAAPRTGGNFGLGALWRARTAESAPLGVGQLPRPRKVDGMHLPSRPAQRNLLGRNLLTGTMVSGATAVLDVRPRSVGELGVALAGRDRHGARGTL